MQKIKSTSHLLYLFFGALCWLLPAITSYFILFHFQGLVDTGFFDAIIAPFQIHDLTRFSIERRLLVLAVQLLPLSLTALICLQLSRLFRLYEQGHLFESANIKLIRSIGIYMMLRELALFIHQPLMTTVLTYGNQPGERFATITLGITNMTTIITALIIIIASWIVKEAQHLKTDAQLTI